MSPLTTPAALRRVGRLGWALMDAPFHIGLLQVDYTSLTKFPASRSRSIWRDRDAGMPRDVCLWRARSSTGRASR